MPETFSRIQQKATDTWNNFDKSQKIRLGIISGVLVLAIALSIYFVTRANYVPLISSEDPKEVGEMIKVLEEKKVRYKPDGNKGILVDSRDNDKAQAAIVQAGYPKTSNVTFDDALSKIKINTTESDKRKIWKNEQESALRAKLKMLDNIKDANVVLALPERSFLLLSDKEQPRPTASVTVIPKSELTPRQVEGIIAMVSRSVEGLSPNDVTVVDNNGIVLNRDSSGEGIDKTNSQYELTMKVKKELEKSVRDFYNGQFENFDSVRVVANPVLNFDKIQSSIAAIEKPTGFDAGVPVSEQTKKENLINGATNGVPGIDTNPGTGNTNTPTYLNGNNGNSTYNKSEKITNYDYTKTNTVQEKAPGSMDPEKSSMAVTLLYGIKALDEAKLSPEFIDSVKQSASMATGIPASRISVNKLKVTPPVQEQPKFTDTVKSLADTYGLMALLLILAVLLIIAVFPRRKREASEPVFDQVATAGGPRFITPESEPVPEIALEERSEVKKQIEKFVKQKPEAVAQLLRNWLSDDWD